MENLSLAINLTFVGMVVVFAALIILSYCIVLLSKILSLRSGRSSGGSTGGSKKETSVSAVSDNGSVELSEAHVSDNELIAVLTAAIQASLGINAGNKLFNRSFKRTPRTAPAWSFAGRIDQISGKL